MDFRKFTTLKNNVTILPQTSIWTVDQIYKETVATKLEWINCLTEAMGLQEAKGF